MSEQKEKPRALGVPAQAPTDLPMPPYRFQRYGGASGEGEGCGTSRQAADILRKANLLGWAATNVRR